MMPEAAMMSLMARSSALDVRPRGEVDTDDLGFALPVDCRGKL
jgi:hypothetical protein